MANSKSEICNIALAKLGSSPTLVDINQDDTKTAQFFRVIYNTARDSLLRQHLWRFARKRAVLAPLSTGPLFDGGNYFQLPVDCLRVIGTDGDYENAYGRWFIEGNKIVADTDVLNIVYISSVDDPTLYDPIFTEALAVKLAHDICMPLAQSEGLRNMLADELRMLTLRAAHAGATEQDS